MKCVEDYEVVIKRDEIMIHDKVSVSINIVDQEIFDFQNTFEIEKAALSVLCGDFIIQKVIPLDSSLAKPKCAFI